MASVVIGAKFRKSRKEARSCHYCKELTQTQCDLETVTWSTYNGKEIIENQQKNQPMCKKCWDEMKDNRFIR